MGAWDAGLYSSDAALDLKATVRALTRLPFDGTQILNLLRAAYAAADDPDDEDHSVFWLVAADQFARQGVACAGACARALELIARGTDLSRMRELGMSPADLRKRERQLQELAARLKQPPAARARKPLAKPQELLLTAGSVWRYPTLKRKSRNPYFATAEKEGFKPDGWGALVTLAAGRAFGWLAWYAVAPVAVGTGGVPATDDVAQGRFYLNRLAYREAAAPAPILGGVGTLTRPHLIRLGLEPLGELRVDTRKILGAEPDAAGRVAAVNDISLSNHLDASCAEADGPALAEFLR